MLISANAPNMETGATNTHAGSINKREYQNYKANNTS